MPNCLYKIQDPKTKGECDACGRYCEHPVRIGFQQGDEVVEGLYGPCCAKQFTEGDQGGTNSPRI